MNMRAIRRRFDHCEIYTTWACNLHCQRCPQTLFFPDGKRPSLMLGWYEFLDFLTGVQQQGHHFKTMEFNGGEPLLWPHLREAAGEVRRRKIADHIILITNGINAQRHMETLKVFDFVRITDYGAINKLDQIHIQRALARRLDWLLPWRKRTVINWICHRKVCDPFREPEPDTLPAHCPSVQTILGPDGRVYACGMNCIEGKGGIGLYEPFIVYLQNRGLEVINQPRCMSCPSNHKCKDPDRPGLSIQAGIVETPFGFLLNIPWLRWWPWRWRISRYYRYWSPKI